MAGIGKINAVPKEYTRRSKDAVSGESYDKGSEKELPWGRFASKIGIIFEVENPAGALSNYFELIIKANSGEIGFTSDIRVVEIYRFAPGQKVMIEDTRFESSPSPSVQYYYTIVLKTTLGLDMFGHQFTVNVTWYEAPLPIRKLEKINARMVDAIPRGKFSQQPLFHIVQTGDYLTGIARQHYADGDRWREIYEANKAVIGNNPNRIYAGQRLIIPKL